MCRAIGGAISRSTDLRWTQTRSCAGVRRSTKLQSSPKLQVARQSYGKGLWPATGRGRKSPTSCACTPTARQRASVPRSTFAGHSGATRTTPASTSRARDNVRAINPDTPSQLTTMKWILCAGCHEYRVVASRARSWSAMCRNRLWRSTHGRTGLRLQFCAWCNTPLVYMPQDRLPGTRRYCHSGCARKAWLVARAQRRMSSIAALELAVQRLRKSRYPRHLAAARVLEELHRELVDRQDAASIAAERGELLALLQGFSTRAMKVAS